MRYRTLLPACFLLQLTFSAAAQKTQVPKYHQKEEFRTVFSKELSSYKQDPKKDTAPATTTRKMAIYFSNKNIYPSDDALELLYSLNQKYDVENTMAPEDTIKEPYFPFSSAVKRQLKKDYKKASKTDRALNDSFRNEAKKYNLMLSKLESKKIPSLMRDSMEMVAKTVLPALQNNSANTSRTQMEYYQATLSMMNQFIDTLLQTKKANSWAIPAIQELMKNMMAAGTFKKRIDFTGSKKSFEFSYPILYKMGIEGLHAGFDHFLPPDPAPPANACVYVFLKNPDSTKPNRIPEENAFRVYYGSNGIQFSLPSASDSLRLFSFQPLAHASTLPIILGHGNYCFLLVDVQTNKAYLKPNINLINNLEYTEDRLVILPFVIEK